MLAASSAAQAEDLPAWRLGSVASNSSAKAELDALFALCISDSVCHKAYHLSGRAPDLDVFRHLLPPGALDEPLMEPLRALMAKATPEQANDKLWLLRLTAYRRTVGHLCDVNHELVFDPASLTSNCVCKPDATCSDELYTLLPFWIALGLVVVLGILLFGALVYTKKRVLEKVEQIGGNQGDMFVALYSAFN